MCDTHMKNAYNKSTIKFNGTRDIGGTCPGWANVLPVDGAQRSTSPCAIHR